MAASSSYEDRKAAIQAAIRGPSPSVAGSGMPNSGMLTRMVRET